MTLWTWSLSREWLLGYWLMVPEPFTSSPEMVMDRFFYYKADILCLSITAVLCLPFDMGRNFYFAFSVCPSVHHIRSLISFLSSLIYEIAYIGLK